MPGLKHWLLLLSMALFAPAFFAQQSNTFALDTTRKMVVVDFLIEGNKVTQERVILREVTFAVGDSLYFSNLRAGMEQSRNNIMNLRLFNFVEVEAVQIDHQQVLVLISVKERWYIYPVPILEIAQTNFNTWWETKELRWLNYGVAVSHNNFRGLNQRLSLMIRFGYTKRFSASYSIPNINRKQTLGLNFSAGFFENDEIVFNTFNNVRQFYRNPEDKALRFMQYSAGLSYRENIFTSHHIQLTYINASSNDTIPILQPDYFAGGTSSSQFLRASYSLSYDTRDYRRYPLKGLLLVGYLQQDGLGIVNRKGLNLFTTTASYRHHHKLSDRLYVAHSITGKVNWSQPPYYQLRALGYNDFVRGYEFYVIDGTHFALLQGNFKVAVLKPKPVSIPFVPSEKFSETFISMYANLFFDAGYVNGPTFRATNSLVNEYLYSMGVGFDVVTYYDKVMRVEGSINALGNFAVFVHFKQAF
jgi:outer membrane protein assembly factor BamA